MKRESIKELLETVCQYNTVNINQTFNKTETDWIEVRCQPDTRILELTYVQTKEVILYESIDEAATVIAKYMNDTSIVNPPDF
ncbi:hypothetical protein [Planomicrobium sp. Y74]|uniref:hypothetical protein n=1 Tax=Planomicrobium sp. Y74 TaxID=2478977 RepID=UPI000EF50E5F|nr:hypothetical protein [Planomicrobium sp. Y74]RLQ84932.1 hypothetical protein D9754_16845 [Planomicrobium sp. Y74]